MLMAIAQAHEAYIYYIEMIFSTCDVVFKLKADSDNDEHAKGQRIIK